MTTNDLIQAKREAYSAGYESVEPLTGLIDATDVIEGARGWADISDERLNHEAYESASQALSHGSLNGAIRDLAVIMYRESLPRVSMDHLTTDDREKVVIEWGYWPNDMSKFECDDIIQEKFESIPHFHEVDRDAREVVERGMADGIHPRREKDPSNL